MHSKWVWLCPEIPTAMRVGTGSEALLIECSETSDFLFLCLSPFLASTRDTSARWRERWTGARSSKQSAKGGLKIWVLSLINSCDFQLWHLFSLNFFICKMEVLPETGRWGEGSLQIWFQFRFLRSAVTVTFFSLWKESFSKPLLIHLSGVCG